MTPLLALTLIAFAPAQAGTLKLTNVRTTYGELGGTRPDTKYMPGDVVFFAYDIEGFTLSESGHVQYRMSMEVLDKNAKAIFKQDPADKVDFLPLGGSKLPARAYVLLGLDMEPGPYTMKLTVVDTASMQQQTLEKTFEVIKLDFGIVGVYASVDERGQIAASTTGQVGQSVFLQFATVGFEREKGVADPQPNVTVEMMPLDDGGKPTMKKPDTFTQSKDSQTKLDKNDTNILFRFMLPMTRPGKYTVRLKATDNITKKTSTFDLPVTVLAPNN